MVSGFRALAQTFWVSPAFAPLFALFPDPFGLGFYVKLLLAVVAGTYLAARTDHSGDRVLAFSLTTMLTYVVVGLALGYPVNDPPVPLAVFGPFYLLGLATGYTLWLGDGIERV
jgi:hypothetical protein